ncbi:hypothetical protein, partial [Pseudomonas aeruginosa]|uniref:hypothetical protein n=1 Tax=Pseudomonas aeruginosa TaxID=287 RepID=UPI0031B9C6D7
SAWCRYSSESFPASRNKKSPAQGLGREWVQVRPFKGAARPAAQCATCRNEKAQLEGWAICCSILKTRKIGRMRQILME